MAGEGVIFISQVPTAGDSGPVAQWILTASWAAAARAVWGKSWILTPEGVFAPEEALRHASRQTLQSRPARWWRPYAPEVAITAYKDLRDARRALRFRRAIKQLPEADGQVKFVWQRHDLFNTVGLDIARALRRPMVLFVDAPTVWEDHKLGVRRPGWGRALEALAERPQFRSADLIACVSDEVASEVCKRGGSYDRIIVTPNGVDTSRFHPDVSGQSVRERCDLTDRFVVGWMGSFRPFHGLELTMRAVSSLQHVIPDLALLLVGDGQERHRMQQLAKELAIREVRFTGTIPHTEVPEYIAAMDVAVVASEAASDFHYSPMKLREYMACSRAIVAPSVGEVSRLLTDGKNAVLVAPGDPGTIAQGIGQLYRRPALRSELGRGARETIAIHSWEYQVRRVWERLEAPAEAARRR
jgi:glycosyltransferase involved in cell wall biosynthesis